MQTAVVAVSGPLSIRILNTIFSEITFWKSFPLRFSGSVPWWIWFNINYVSLSFTDWQNSVLDSGSNARENDPREYNYFFVLLLRQKVESKKGARVSGIGWSRHIRVERRKAESLLMVDGEAKKLKRVLELGKETKKSSPKKIWLQIKIDRWITLTGIEPGISSSM